MKIHSKGQVSAFFCIYGEFDDKSQTFWTRYNLLISHPSRCWAELDELFPPVFSACAILS